MIQAERELRMCLHFVEVESRQIWSVHVSQRQAFMQNGVLLLQLQHFSE